MGGDMGGDMDGDVGGEVVHGPRGRLDLVLRLLDHQIVGPNGQLLGNVDDVELTPAGSALGVTGIGLGPAALGQRLPGLLGSWTRAVWRRLHPEADPQALVVPVSRVVDVGSALRVDDAAARSVASALGFENWLRDHVISRIPGATGGGDPEREQDDDATEDGAPRRGATGRATRAPRPESRWLSGLLGAEVHDDAGRRIGKVLEIRARAGDGTWPITHLHCTRSALGAELGYHVDPRQGPALIGGIVRYWQRHDVLVPVADITAIEEGPTRIILVARDDRQHPHAAGAPS